MNRKKLVLTLALAVLTAGAGASDDDLDDLFDLDAPLEAGEEAAGGGLRLGGYAEFGAAYTYRSPTHWSKLRGRAELSATGRLGGGIRFKVTGRADYDAAYDVESRYYPHAVRGDQRSDFSLRETYLDFSSGEWEFRLGRQHVVWGEMVGLFLADVVSARDMREFVLPEFETMRIPQWAARAEYFAGDTHFELLWIPYASYDEIGKPGADFYPYPLPADTRVRDRRPSRSLSNSNWGLRISHLVSGWDLTAFYYQSRDVTPTLYRTSLAPTFELRNDRIHQIGGTFSKDYGQFVFKGEAVHTRGRSFLTIDDPVDPFGLRRSNTLDYVIGVDVPVRDVWRFNAQYFGRHAYRHRSDMGYDRDEGGITLLVNRRIGTEFEAEVLYVTSLNRHDYMLRPKLIWNISPEWRGQFGADIFGGRAKGMFGRFDDSDRVYFELRRWF